MSHWSKAILKAGVPVIWDYFSWMIRYSGKNKDKYPMIKRYNALKKLARRVSKAFDVEFHIEGQQTLPKGPFCLFPNHYSSFDPVLLIDVLDTPTTFVAKKELSKVAFLGKCTRAIDGLFMDRKNLKQSLIVMKNVEESLKTKDLNWIIFPEGTRNKDFMANINQFHHGSFRPAVKAGVPIVPVAIYGTDKVLKKKPKYKKYHVFIKFLNPILPDDYKDMSTEDIAKYSHDLIQKTISYDLGYKYFASMKADKKYHFNKLSY